VDLPDRVSGGDAAIENLPARLAAVSLIVAGQWIIVGETGTEFFHFGQY